METYIQGMIVKFNEYEKKVAFVYIRRKPNKEDILILKKECEGCILIFRYLNLNPTNESEKMRLELLCGKEKQIFLKEITTNLNNQLDHIVGDKSLEDKLYCSSFLTLYLTTSQLLQGLELMEIGFQSNFLRILILTQRNILKRTKQMYPNQY